jgi:hypothetical protein
MQVSQAMAVGACKPGLINGAKKNALQVAMVR